VQESIRRFRCSFLQSGREKLFNVLPAQELARAVQEEVGVWRDRRYAPLVALRLFVEQVLHTDHACQDVVARYASERVAQGEAQVSLSSGPYCNARQRLPLRLVERLGKRVGERLQDGCAQGWKWRGRSVKIVDGTTVTMPDTEDNQARYPQHGEQKPGLGFPIARLVALVSLGCGAVLNWAMGPYKGKQTGEDALFRLLYGSLVKGDIVLADRYHCSYFTVAVLYLMGVDVLTRQHARRVTDFRRGQRLGKRDHLVVWERPARPEVRLPADPAEPDHDAHAPEQPELLEDVGRARRDLGRRRPVGRGRAPDRRGDPGVPQPQAVPPVARRRLVGEPRVVERVEEPVTAPVAREHPPRAVAAVGRGREPHEHEPRARVAEAGHRPRPVALAAVAARRRRGARLTVGDESRASAAGDDARAEPGEGGIQGGPSVPRWSPCRHTARPAPATARPSSAWS